MILTACWARKPGDRTCRRPVAVVLVHPSTGARRPLCAHHEALALAGGLTFDGAEGPGARWSP